MKLQGKKTGAVANFVGYIDQATPTIDLPTGNTMLTVRYMDAGFNCYKDYKTIAEFNKDWEDYAAEEPLIKDERIRKAIRAWAELNSIKSVAFENYDDENIYFIDRDYEPQIWFSKTLIAWELDDGQIYTITELCGEEEECEN